MDPIESTATSGESLANPQPEPTTAEGEPEATEEPTAAGSTEAEGQAADSASGASTVEPAEPPVDVTEVATQSAEPPAEPDHGGGKLAGLVMAGALVVAYVTTGPRVEARPAFRAGAADAARILDGEVWRTAI